MGQALNRDPDHLVEFDRATPVLIRFPSLKDPRNHTGQHDRLAWQSEA
jgi:hypothetical protein